MARVRLFSGTKAQETEKQMLSKNKDFVNIQKMIGLKLESEKKIDEPMNVSAAMHLSSYELVSFLRNQMERADKAMTRHELNMKDVSRIARKKL